MILDHEPIEVNEFGGVWDRDSFTDSIPADHFIDSLNTVTKGEQTQTRDGSSLSLSIANIKRARLYKRQGETTRIIILDSGGNFYDSSVSLVIPFLTIAGAVDFTLGAYNNRAYISPIDSNGNGLSGSFVYVWQGSGSARKAAGTKPSSGFNIALSVSAGTVEAGTHIFAWCFETDTGFVTQPGPATFQTIVAPGNKALDFTNIPVGPSGTSARRLIASKAIQNYNGNQDGYEMFFVPGGKISNNTATSLSTIDFFDADLQDSADYTFDQLEEIPACAFIVPYQNRLTYGNINTSKSLVYVSKNNEPESVNSLAGFLTVDPHDTEGVKNAIEFRDNFYLFKSIPGRTYSTRDNGYDASTWPNPIPLDGSVGTGVNGVAQLIDTNKAFAEFFLVADISGLYKFTGSFGDPKYHLARKIQRIWKRINKAQFDKVQVAIDTENFLIYVTVPLDGVTDPNYILVGDYQNGLDWKNIIWHIWNSALWTTPIGVIVDIDTTTKKTYLRIANSSHIYNQVEDQFNDGGNAINNYIKFALLYLKTRAIHHYGGIGLRIIGSGNLNINLTGLDSSNSADLATLALSTTPGQEYLAKSNFVNEKCSVKISLNSVDKYFKLRGINLYTNIQFETRPI